ncbi:tRNA-uridine aminocarboxypropyltransferase [Endozoicomonas arenosclerae]|uniref:tRNA-uridine aminocarboxypropyltransferase n=1 Tax=Endozoicomonas arenosclerae TaxID=1633495 RepID=UPI000780EE51|nr:tRNA-uridine aminocarboxypropyltransferase [Endozoicomonas arenosclerae]
MIYLLTHPLELLKASNTGRLVKEVMPETIVESWSRVEPPEQLLAMLESDSFAPKLVFPEAFAIYQQYDEVFKDSGGARKPLYILLDGTWQQARKMYRQSPYLHNLPLCEIQSDEKSVYDLRRNQASGGLCTAEVAAEVLVMEGFPEKCLALKESLALFCKEYR